MNNSMGGAMSATTEISMKNIKLPTKELTGVSMTATDLKDTTVMETITKNGVTFRLITNNKGIREIEVSCEYEGTKLSARINKKYYGKLCKKGLHNFDIYGFWKLFANNITLLINDLEFRLLNHW